MTAAWDRDEALRVLCPPSLVPDCFFGRCVCGWLLAGWHASAFDQPGWARVRLLWLYVPEDD